MALPGLVRPPISIVTARGGVVGGARPVVSSAIPDAGEPPTPLVTAQLQDVFPPRVLVSVTGLATWNAVGITIYRVVSGERTPLRGAEDVTLTGDDSFVRTDAEEPFGVPISYVAEVTQANGSTFEESSPSLTVTLPGGKVVISDAINGNASEVEITAWPEKRTSRQSTTYVVGGRSVVVSGQRGEKTSSVEIFTEFDSQREAFDSLLSDATSGVLQIRQAGGYGGIDDYLAVMSDSERRWSQDGSDPRRLWTLDVVHVEAWPNDLEARGFTLQDIADRYFGKTLLNFSADYSTLLAVAQGDFSA